MNELSYAAPPLDELVIGVSFSPIKELKIPHIGVFWKRVQEEFPRCEHAPAIGDFNEIVDEQTGYPVPRVWFINSSDDILIQLQRNKMLLNWRKRQDSYPRFDHLFEKFSKAIDVFKVVLADYGIKDLCPIEFEISYINIIPQDNGWDSIENINYLFPSIRIVGDVNCIGEVHGIVHQVTYDLPDDTGALVVKIQNAYRISDKHPVFTFELSARGPKNASLTLDMMRQWYENARHSIHGAFGGLSSEEVQSRVWAKK